MGSVEQLSAHGRIFSELVIEVFRANGLLLAAGDDLARPFGLTSARWQVLGVIEHEPSSVSHVARTMGLTRQSVQQTADALAVQGMLTFEENPRHRRSPLMALTGRGRTALDHVERCQATWANRIGGRVEPTELDAALRTLRDLSRLLDPDHREADQQQPDQHEPDQHERKSP